MVPPLIGTMSTAPSPGTMKVPLNPLGFPRENCGLSETITEDRREIGMSYAFAPPRIYETLLALPAKTAPVFERGQASSAGKLVEATYRRPYQMHASIGPSCGG